MSFTEEVLTQLLSDQFAREAMSLIIPVAHVNARVFKPVQKNLTLLRLHLKQRGKREAGKTLTFPQRSNPILGLIQMGHSQALFDRATNGWIWMCLMGAGHGHDEELRAVLPNLVSYRQKKILRHLPGFPP